MTNELPRRRRNHRRTLVLASLLSLAVLGTSCAPSGFWVRRSDFPTPAEGFSNSRITRATYSPHYTDGVGAMRVNCSLSHMNYDDPIVFPGKKRSTHLHAYFGNTDVDYSSTSESIANSGNTTCTGGITNRTAYWAPAVVDTVTRKPVMPWGENGLQVYYKTGYRGVPSNQVVNMPAGLRMIAGNATSTTPQTGGHLIYYCESNPNPQFSFPNCAPGDRLVMAVEFPQCWNGRDLDSPDHKSHMAYGAWGPQFGRNGAGCPASHPVPIPSITQNFRYPVPAGGMANWRLVSDMYEGPAGYSGHADWWNGWDEAVFQKVIDNCYSRSLDCSMNLLGDGTMLY